jgi:hypothetical protein
MTGQVLAGDAEALVAGHPEVLAAIEPRVQIGARVLEEDREGRPTALYAAIETPWERWHLVALLNWREGPALLALPLERCGLSAGDEWLVYDVWGRASLGIATHAVGRRAPGRSCLLMSLRANLGRPQIVGTTRHVTAGAVELADVTWDEATSTLRGQAGPDAMDLMLRSPHPHVPTTALGGDLGPLAEARVSLALPPASGWREWSVAFGTAPPSPRRGLPLHLVGELSSRGASETDPGAGAESPLPLGEG